MKISPTISRRFILRGMGASLALPFLPSLLPRGAQAAGAPPALIVFRQANGVQGANPAFQESERFYPRNFGPLALGTTDADRALGELKDFQSKLLVIGGLNISTMKLSGCAHSHGINQLLTASLPTGGGDKSLGTHESIDNRIARELHPGVEPLAFYCSPNYEAIPSGLSYRGPRNIRGGERDPSLVFASLMGSVGVDDATQARLLATRKSINDLMRNELKELQSSAQLSSVDQERLKQHVDSIRDVERKLTCALDASKQQQLAGAGSLLDDDTKVETIAQLQMDVMVLAVACGNIRAATMQMGGGGSHTRFTINGKRLEPFHGISHRTADFGDGATTGPNASSAEKHHQIDRLHARLFRYLLTQMQAQGILDSSVALWCNDMRTGPQHFYDNVPFILGGSANGYFKQGQYINAGGVLHNRLLNSLLNAVGLRNGGALIDNFGDGSAPNGQLTDALA
jgi:Protein of unknown function (DUF1552)